MEDKSLTISGGACVFFAFMLLILPLRWLLAAVFAAVFHELCHILAILLCGGKILDFKVRSHGCVLTVSPLSYGREVICAMAGPVGGLLLIFVAKWFPRAAICGIFQSAYNLLPFYPLDGGRMIFNGTYLLFPPMMAEKICNIIQKSTIILIGIAGISVTFLWNFGIIPLLFLFLVLIRMKFGKIPCKL